MFRFGKLDDCRLGDYAFFFKSYKLIQIIIIYDMNWKSILIKPVQSMMTVGIVIPITINYYHHHLTHCIISYIYISNSLG